MRILVTADTTRTRCAATAGCLAAIGRGGQVLLSDATRAIVAGDLPEDVGMRWLGERTLRDIERPEPLTELVIPDVPVTGSEDRGAPPVGTATPLPERSSPDRDPSDWIPDAARRWLPGGERTRDLIEQRVMSAIEEAFEEKGRRTGPRRTEPGRGPANRSAGSGPSVADEIDRLRGLRDAGALTEEQYRRAVDRVVGETGTADAEDSA